MDTQLEAVLGEWSIAERIDAGKHLEELEEHPGFQAILRLLDESREFAYWSLVHAPKAVESVAAVQKQLGIVRGLDSLRSAIPTIRAVAERAQQERDAAAERADAERETSQ